jgi:hypothetical protein
MPYCGCTQPALARSRRDVFSALIGADHPLATSIRRTELPGVPLPCRQCSCLRRLPRHCSQRGARPQPKGLTPTAPSRRAISSRSFPAPRGATVNSPRRKPRGAALARKAPKGRKCHRVSPSAPSGLPDDRPGPTGFTPVAIDLRPFGTVRSQRSSHRRCPATAGLFGPARHGVCPTRESNTAREIVRERARNERLV